MNSRTYVQVARAEASERTRQALMDAATAEFFDRPWSELSLEVVARKAGTTKQTLLRHFGSKSGLFDACAERAMGAVADQRFAAPTDDIAGAIDNLLDHYDEAGARALKLSGAGDDYGEGMAAAAAQGRALHYDWVDHAFGLWLNAFAGPERTRRRAAVIALCDVQTWSILANDLGLRRADVHATLLTAITPLLEDPS